MNELIVKINYLSFLFCIFIVFFFYCRISHPAARGPCPPCSGEKPSRASHVMIMIIMIIIMIIIMLLMMMIIIIIIIIITLIIMTTTIIII